MMVLLLSLPMAEVIMTTTRQVFLQLDQQIILGKEDDKFGTNMPILSPISMMISQSQRDLEATGPNTIIFVLEI